MSGETFGLLFEIYLVAGTTLLFIGLFNHPWRQTWVRYSQRFRPSYGERDALITIIILLVGFVPLTILSTIHRLGILLPARPQ